MMAPTIFVYLLYKLLVNTTYDCFFERELYHAIVRLHYILISII